MDAVTFGPMQLLVIVFDNPDFHDQIQRELESVMKKGLVRLIDLLFVWKEEEGNIRYVKAAQLDEEEMCFGIVIEGLIRNGADDEEFAREGTEAGILAAAQENYGITGEDILEIIESIPESTAAAILIIEHLWAKNLKKSIHDTGGILVCQGMLKPELLAPVREELSEAVEAAEKRSRPRAVAPL